MSVRASYREAVEWIALNDGAGDPGALSPEDVACQLSVMLVADLWRKSTLEVARAVVRWRKKHCSEWYPTG